MKFELVTYTTPLPQPPPTTEIPLEFSNLLATLAGIGNTDGKLVGRLDNILLIRVSLPPLERYSYQRISFASFPEKNPNVLGLEWSSQRQTQWEEKKHNNQGNCPAPQHSKLNPLNNSYLLRLILNLETKKDTS